MRKTPNQKLQLAAETLRRLDPAQLQKAAGGWSNPFCPSRRDTVCC